MQCPNQYSPSLGSCPWVTSCGVSSSYLSQLISLRQDSIGSSVPLLCCYNGKFGMARKLVTGLSACQNPGTSSIKQSNLVGKDFSTDSWSDLLPPKPLSCLGVCHRTFHLKSQKIIKHPVSVSYLILVCSVFLGRSHSQQVNFRLSTPWTQYSASTMNGVYRSVQVLHDFEIRFQIA